MIKYIIDENGYMEVLPENPTMIDLGEYQDRNYGHVEKLVDKTFEIDIEEK